jgi:hypothetical protein
MALALNKIILASAVANTPGAYFQITTTPATTVGNVIPAGVYIVFPTANVTIQATSAVNATTGNATTTSIVLANNTGGMIFSDGVNVFANSSVTNATVTLLTVDGGQNVSGTFNAS